MIGDLGGDRPVTARSRALPLLSPMTSPRRSPPDRLGQGPLTVAEVVLPGLFGLFQHLDGADAGVGEPARHRRRRRAAVRPLPGRDRHRPPGRGGRDPGGETDWAPVVASLAPPPAGTTVAYQKHMAHYLLPEIDHAWIRELTNVLLIRDPARWSPRTRRLVRRSPRGHRPAPAGALYDEPGDRGEPPPVIDAGDFSAPRALPAPCDQPRAWPSQTACWTWPPGPRSTDGPWAPYWYEAVWRSTGLRAAAPLRGAVGRPGGGGRRGLSSALPAAVRGVGI